MLYFKREISNLSLFPDYLVLKIRYLFFENRNLCQFFPEVVEPVLVFFQFGNVPFSFCVRLLVKLEIRNLLFERMICRFLYL